MKGFDFEAFLGNVVEHYDEALGESVYEDNFGSQWNDVLFDSLMSTEEKKKLYLAAQQDKRKIMGWTDITVSENDPWLIDLWGENVVAAANEFANNPDMTNPDATIQNVLSSLMFAKKEGNTAQVNAFNGVLRSYVSSGYDVYSLMNLMSTKAAEMSAAIKGGAQADASSMSQLSAMQKAVGHLEYAERLASPYRVIFNNAERLGGLRNRLQELESLQGATTPEQDKEMDSIQDEIFAVETTLKKEMQGYDLDYLQTVVGNKKQHLFITNEGRNGAIDKDSIDADMFNGLGRLGMLISFERKRQAPVSESEGM